jgi:hypothetical protein
MIRRGLSNNRAELHKELGFLALILLAGCATPQEKLAMYGCTYYPKESGFCCKHEVPEFDHYIFNCKYAGDCTYQEGD